MTRINRRTKLQSSRKLEMKLTACSVLVCCLLFNPGYCIEIEPIDSCIFRCSIHVDFVPVFSQLAIEVDGKTAGFKLSVNKQQWLNSADVFLTSKSVQYSSDRGDLLLNRSSKWAGQDALGKFIQENFFFSTIGHPNPLPHNVTLKVMFRRYDNLPAILFGQV